MKTLKKVAIILLVVCMSVCFFGCGDEFDRFKAAGVYIIDYTGGNQYTYIIDHATDANAILDKVKELKYEEDETAQPSTSYLLFRFYNDDVSKEVLFTIYDNGTCCLSRVYTVEKGKTAYIELARMYEASTNIVLAEDFVSKKAEENK